MYFFLLSKEGGIHKTWLRGLKEVWKTHFSYRGEYRLIDSMSLKLSIGETQKVVKLSPPYVYSKCKYNFHKIIDYFYFNIPFIFDFYIQTYNAILPTFYILIINAVVSNWKMTHHHPTFFLLFPLNCVCVSLRPYCH